MTSTQTTSPAEPAAPLVFAPHKSYRTIGRGTLLLYGALTFAGVVFPWILDSVRKPLLASALFGGVFGFFSLLSIYILRTFYRARLFLFADYMRAVGAFGERSVAFSEIIEARWRRYPAGGSIALHTAGRRLVIEFGTYAGERELIELLRNRIPADLQKNFEPFAQAVLVKRKPVVVEGRTSLWLSLASLLVAVLCLFLHRFFETWFLALLLLMMSGPLAILETMDGFRKRTLTLAAASLLAWAAVAGLCYVMWSGTFARWQ